MDNLLKDLPIVTVVRLIADYAEGFTDEQREYLVDELGSCLALTPSREVTGVTSNGVFYPTFDKDAQPVDEPPYLESMPTNWGCAITK